MRILFVTNMWPDQERPWYGSFIYSQARSLRQLGVELDVVAIRGYAGSREYARAARTLLAGNFGADHDVVHAHYGHSGVVARLDVRRPLVVSYCGADLLGDPMRGNPTKMTRESLALAAGFAQLSRLASATITKSRHMEQNLPRRARSRNHVIPNGVDLDMFTRVEKASARRELGWAPDETAVLFVGNPKNERKNYALAERACELAASRSEAVRMRVATGIPPEQVSLWMSAADALIHPSWSEGSPNVIKEAMACELPVLATGVGDVPERLEGVPGCHVLPPDAELFAEALLDAVTHHPCPEARAAVTHLSLENVARQVLDVYRSVL